MAGESCHRMLSDNGGLLVFKAGPPHNHCHSSLGTSRDQREAQHPGVALANPSWEKPPLPTQSSLMPHPGDVCKGGCAAWSPLANLRAP